ncbi:hypothetical protein PAXINDRAFT_102859 [Paxillus involutus ATCC 200175]|uniref:Unplaced genomic scaffold PAXINscaffold_492, whole genome shotgun sequence n=1 Tax=Paxillus involutus ATCC 200175 TaxID=664439 RepID=A0A0C9SNC5_PAXIN|nr:hypothetical protein PAXINDRAFT_102859 [Paxillus involutus ATCC 200175]
MFEDGMLDGLSSTLLLHFYTILKRAGTGSVDIEGQQPSGTTPLIEIRIIAVIAQYALGLLNTHQTRLDHADLGPVQRDSNHNGYQRQVDEPRYLYRARVASI